MCIGCVSCSKGVSPTEKADNGTTASVNETEEPTAQPSEAPTEEPTEEPTEDEGEFPKPDVTVNAAVATGINIIGGLCKAECVGITVTDTAGNTTEIIPDRASGYFLGQVKFDADTELSVVANYEGGVSEAISCSVEYEEMVNMMESDEYMPVFCNDSRMHFYSAVLAYSKSDPVTDSVMTRAEKNISENVAAVKAANPDAELIYLVAPSSATVYAEGLPEEYPKAEGQTLYEAFESIATACGAKVIYPLDTFIENKDDGNGYKVYHNTDSHWTTYGAYLALSEMMTYISGKFPAAKPHTMEEMGFYTTTMWGGDALFSFGDYNGFEDYSYTGRTGETEVTGISELTTLYSLETPTKTIDSVYRGSKSTYVSGDSNSHKATVVNPNGEGLPTALIVRDSFSCPAYDMVNERFSKVWWQSSHNYGIYENELTARKPDYVIYIVSERNLLKVMTENENATLVRR